MAQLDSWRGGREWAGVLCGATGLFLIFVHIAALSQRQSIVLSIVLTVALIHLERRFRSLKPAWRFTPYWVGVWPQWSQLLTDFKLISGVEELHLIEESLRALPPMEYRVLRSGISFTVIHQSEDFQRALIYWNQTRGFGSKFDFSAKIEPVKTEHGEVYFFIRGRGDRYDLGIDVPTKWWNEVKARCPAPMNEDEDGYIGNTKLTLATVSDREFDFYREPIVVSRRETRAFWYTWELPEYHAWIKAVEDTRKEQQSKLGWKSDIEQSGRIVHTYFVVYHSEI